MKLVNTFVVGSWLLGSVAFATETPKVSHPTCLVYSVVESEGVGKRDIDDGELVRTQLLKFQVNQFLRSKGWNVIQTTSRVLITKAKMIGQDHSFIENGDEVHFYMATVLQDARWGANYIKFTMNRYKNEKPVMSEIAFNHAYINKPLNLKKINRQLNLDTLIPECIKD